MIPLVINTGSAAIDGVWGTFAAAFHGLANTLWTGSFGG